MIQSSSVFHMTQERGCSAIPQVGHVLWKAMRPLAVIYRHMMPKKPNSISDGEMHLEKLWHRFSLEWRLYFDRGFLWTLRQMVRACSRSRSTLVQVYATNRTTLVMTRQYYDYDTHTCQKPWLQIKKRFFHGVQARELWRISGLPNYQ
jgi:hypothetical protein